MNTDTAVQTPTREAVIQRVYDAQNELKRDRQRGLASLNTLFREGEPPNPPLDGRTTGQVVAVDIAPIVTPLTAGLLARWMPWQGKTFNAANSTGDNIFLRSSMPVARVLFPFYRDYIDDGAQTFRAFTFRTYIAAGQQDPDRQVFKIDYDSPANPPFTIRRILDELVQITDNYYLGKAHVRWWWGTWQLVVYFALQKTSS